jgi:hypothetical protein
VRRHECLFSLKRLPPQKRPEDEQTSGSPFPLIVRRIVSRKPFLAQREAVSITLAATAEPPSHCYYVCDWPCGDGQIAFWVQSYH